MNVSILMQTAMNVIEAGMLFIQITVTVTAIYLSFYITELISLTKYQIQTIDLLILPSTGLPNSTYASITQIAFHHQTNFESRFLRSGCNINDTQSKEKLCEHLILFIFIYNILIYFYLYVIL